MAVTMKNAIFWDFMPCGSCKNQHFRGISTFIIRVTRTVFLRSMRWLLVTANIHSSPILVTLMMEALNSSETLALTRTTWRNIPEDDILHSYHRENLKSH
jgi:hypothetical protein